ncbi:hypothetical protein [Microbacterium sp. NPDC058389]|uniref:hypothetical protein n=1 Tax=Microbacterium sp. NPDC058389 TaxID=3346475 RepID=UPI00365F9673
MQTTRRASWPVLTMIGVGAWIVAPFIALCLLTAQALNAASVEPRPVVVAAEHAVGDLNRPVALGLQWSDPLPIPAPEWAGIVQEVYVSAGDAVVDGTPIARIGSIRRLAALTSYPFDRPLALGDTGEDVAMLSSFLRARGLDAPDVPTFDERTLAAVRSYAASIGVPEAGSVAAFDPGWVMFLLAERPVATIDVVIGSSAPAQGSVVLQLAPQVVDAVLWEDGTQPPAEGSVEHLTPSASASPTEALLVGGQTVALDETRTRVSADGLDALASLVAAGTSVAAANLIQPAEDGQWVVPAPALVTSEGGSCVFVRRDDKQVRLDATAFVSISGTVVIEADLRPGDEVIILPVTQRITCG